MSSGAPSPCLPLTAMRVEAGTSGATGQTTRCVGRSPLSGLPCGFAGMVRQDAARNAAVFPVGAALNALGRVDGCSTDRAGALC